MFDKRALRGAVIAAVVLGFAAAPVLAQQQAAAWSMMTPMPQVRNELQAVTVNGKIYLIGGGTEEMKDGKAVEDLTEGFVTEYDAATGTMRERTHGPEGLTHQGIAVLNGKIYLAGGFAAGRHLMSSASFYSYEPATDKWQTLPPLSETRGAVALAAVGGKIHAIGGRIMGEDMTLAAHDVYDPAKNTWSKAAPLPGSRDHVAIFVVDGKIHVIGGRTSTAMSNIGDHIVYDPAKDTWTPAAPMPTPRSSVAFAEYHGLLFVAGGECNMGKAFDNVEAYDTKNNRWLTFPALPAGRHGFAAAVAADRLIFFGGSERCGGGNKTADALQLTLK